MLLMLENFDNTGSFEDFSSVPTIVSGQGRGGSFAALNLSSKIKFKPSKRVVLGFYVREYTTGYIQFGYVGLWGDYINSFKITITKTTKGVLTVTFFNQEQANISGYPAIANQLAYQDTDTGYSLIELFIDIQNATAVEGLLKMAVDGVECFSIDNVITSPTNLYTEGEESIQSFIQWVSLSGFPYIDSLYICNEDKGYNDYFFGPFDISSLPPISDGDYSNWERREFSVSVDDSDDRSNYLFVNKKPFDSNNAEFLNIIASQTLVRDLYGFNTNLITSGKDIFAVELRSWFKGLSEHQNIDNISALTPISKVLGREVTEESNYTGFARAFLYQQLRAPFDVIPDIALAWTREYLDNMQFGFCFYETELVEAVSSSNFSATIVSGSYASLYDGTDSGLTIPNSTSLTISFPSPIYFSYLRLKLTGSVTMFRFFTQAGDVSYPSGYTDPSNSSWLIYRNLDFPMTKVTKIIITAYNSYSNNPVFKELSIKAWSRVGA